MGDTELVALGLQRRAVGGKESRDEIVLLAFVVPDVDVGANR